MGQARRIHTTKLAELQLSLVELEPVDASSAPLPSSAFPFYESSEPENTQSESSEKAAKLVRVVLHRDVDGQWQRVISNHDAARIKSSGARSALLQCRRSWWQTRPRGPR